MLIRSTHAIPTARRLAFSLILTLGLYAGCGAQSATPGVDAGSAAGDNDAAIAAPDTTPPTGALAAPDDGKGLQVSMALSLEASQEATYCQRFVLPAGTSIDVSRFEHRYSKGSHHLILFTTDRTAADGDSLDPFECGTLGLPGTGIAYAAQASSGTLALPAGVAHRFPGESVVLLQTHYLNASPNPVDAEVHVNLWFSDVPVTIEAGTLFFYNQEIVVPAHGSFTAKMRCDLPSNVQLFSAMSHMHRRGVAYRSSLSGGALGDPLDLYTTNDWEGISPKIYDSPIAMTSGQQIEFECDYLNDTDDAIDQGPSAQTNEMCMFIGTYYPKMDRAAELCGVADSGPLHAGTKTCGEVLSCMQMATSQMDAQVCRLSTCDASSAAINRFSGCAFVKCPDCATGGPNCGSCVLSTCASEYTDCQAATCDQ